MILVITFFSPVGFGVYRSIVLVLLSVGGFCSWFLQPGFLWWLVQPAGVFIDQLTGNDTDAIGFIPDPDQGILEIFNVPALADLPCCLAFLHRC